MRGSSKSASSTISRISSSLSASASFFPCHGSIFHPVWPSYALTPVSPCSENSSRTLFGRLFSWRTAASKPPPPVNLPVRRSVVTAWMRSMPPTVLMYFAMMSSAVCADSGRAKSVSPASFRRVFGMGSPRRDTVFDSGSPKIVVCGGAARGPSSPTACASPGFRHDRAIVGHQLSRSTPPSGGGRPLAGRQSGLRCAGRFRAVADGLGSVPVVSRRRKGLRVHGDVVEKHKPRTDVGALVEDDDEAGDGACRSVCLLVGREPGVASADRDDGSARVRISDPLGRARNWRLYGGGAAEEECVRRVAQTRDEHVPSRGSCTAVTTGTMIPRQVGQPRDLLALQSGDDRERSGVGRRRRHLLEVKSEVAVSFAVRQALLRLPRPERTLSEATGAQVHTLPSAGIERGSKRRRGSRPITAGQSQRDRERAASEEPLHESLLFETGTLRPKVFTGLALVDGAFRMAAIYRPIG